MLFGIYFVDSKNGYKILIWIYYNLQYEEWILSSYNHIVYGPITFQLIVFKLIKNTLV